MKNVISKEDINKLNSTEGIISLLCDIPDFTFDKMDDLDEETRYLVEDTLRIQLLTPSQIDINLRRSLEANNLALLNIRRSTALALYYFGNKDENGHYISYTCPYTGKVFNLNEVERERTKPRNKIDKNKVLELEHIIPHSSNGGTVLFNVLPASHEANSFSEKSNLHLLDWYSQSGNKYYNSENLHDIVSYILTAYSVSLQDFEESEWDECGIESEELLEDNESLDNPLAGKKRNKNKQLTEIEGYYPFLKSLINKLDQEGYDVSLFNQELRNLEEKNIFKDIEKLDIIQETVERIISNYLNDQSNSYLTYSLNINYLKLLESISANTKEEIEQELEKRFNHIKSIMDDNEKPIIDYFISLRDLEDKDILYKEKPTEKELEIFINNIKVSYYTKIEIFIDMLSDDKYTSYKGGDPDPNNIFGKRNKVPYKGYEHIEGLTTSAFWNSNNPKIEARLEEKLKTLEEREPLSEKEVDELQKLKKAAKAIKDYEFTNHLNLAPKIEVFIDMLSDDKYTSYRGGKLDSNNIFKAKNKVPYKGYEHIEGLTTSAFWKSNNPKIEARLEEKISTLEERKTLSEKELEELQKLKKAAKAIKDYEFTNHLNLAPKIEVFIDMLSEDKYTSYKGGEPDSNNIFSQDNEVPYKGYEHIEGLTTGQFWNNNNPEIEARLEEKIRVLEERETLSEKEVEELQKLKKATKAIADYEFTNKQNLASKIEVFIDMLSEDKYTSYKGGTPDSNNIFSQDNEVPYKGYEHIEGLTIGKFWNNNNPEIKARLEEKIKILEERETLSEKEVEELQKLKKAAKAIADYEFTNKKNLASKIGVFIDMLSEDKYTSYRGGKPDSNNIFGKRNKVPYKGYEHIEGLTIGMFWKNNKEKQIIPRLFYNRCYDSEKKEYVVSDKDYSGKEYDKARSSILKYLKVNSIEEYIEQLQKKKTKTKKIKDLLDLLELCHKANEEIAKEDAKLREEIKEDKHQLEEKMGGIAI